MARTGKNTEIAVQMTHVGGQACASMASQVLGVMRVAACFLPLTLGLGACSSVPDSFNPVHWYDWAMESTDEEDDPADGSDVVSASKGRAPADGLVADTANSGYAAPVRRDVAETKPLVKRPASEAVMVAAANTPAPAAPVVAAPAAPARPNVPDVVPVPTKTVSLLDHYHQRLQESAANSVVTQVSATSVSSDGSVVTKPVRLHPPKASASGANAAGSSFQVATLNFRPGTSDLSPSDLEVLRDVVRLFKTTGGYVRVVGLGVSGVRAAPTVVISSASQAGGATSQGRADAAARELVRLGVPSAKVLIGAVAPGTPPAADGAAARIYLDM